MALTDRALAFLARKDRTSVAVAKKRWSGAPLFPGTPFVWDNVTGARSRQLLRNVEHTAAVHSFLASMTVQAGLLDWEVSQVDPPRRASRHFKHGDGMRSVNPDAFGVLRKGDTTWPFLLEWERRAVRPSTMSERLAPYLRYFSSHRPTDDHGTRPSVLIVFDDEIVQTHFLRLARDEMQAKGVAVPLWVSHRAAIEQLGPLGRAWRAPDDWQSPHRRNEQRLTSGKRRDGSRSLPQRKAESHAFARRPQQEERPPEAWWTDRCPAQHGGPIGAAHAAERLPELARQGGRGQPRLHLDAGQRGAHALRSHSPPDAQGPGFRRLRPTFHYGG